MHDDPLPSLPMSGGPGLETEHMRAKLAHKLFGKSSEPLKVGRYVIVDRLGAGASGVVFRAFDPDLDRRVAIKLLNLPQGDEVVRAASWREGKALAQLSHPNVVTVHEIGEHQDSIYLVMEFVDGGDLAHWVREHTPTVAQGLELVLAAGRGLAMAHRQGLVHRDFKPANVLVTSDGIAKVADFGLARSSAWQVTTARTECRQFDSNADSGDDLAAAAPATIAVGTPVYMAPELREGASATVASDVFAFCVSAWEVVFGRRPWADLPWTGGTPPSTTARPVPRGVRKLLERGLARDPAERWRSMDELLSAFDRMHRSRRRKLAAVSALGLVTVVAAGSRSVSTEDSCPDPAVFLEDTFADGRLQRIGQAFVATGLPFAEQSWDQASARLGRYRDEWLAMQRDACEANRVRKEQSAELFDLRMQCLRGRRDELDAVIAVLEPADHRVVEHAGDIVERLGDIGRCGDLDSLRSPVAQPDPSDMDTVERIRSSIARVRALNGANKHDEASLVLAQARESLGELHYPPVRNELDYWAARLEDSLGRTDPARTGYEAVLAAALAAHQDELAIEVAADLTLLSGEVQASTAEALAYARTALGLARRPGVTPRLEVAALLARSSTLATAGRHDEGIADAERALEILARLPEPSPGETSRAHSALGRLLYERGEGDRAEQELRTAMDIRERAFGSDHPMVARTRDGFGVTLSELGRFVEAEAEHRRVLETWSRTLPPEHPDIAAARSNLSIALSGQGRYAEAAAEARQAIDIWTKAYGARSVQVAFARAGLSTTLSEMRQYVEAEAEVRTAMSIIAEALSPDHPHVGRMRSNLAVILAELGRLDEAEREHRLAIEEKQHSLGPDHPSLALGLNMLARLLLSKGELAEAEVEARRGLAIRERAFAPDHPNVIASVVLLGQVLHERRRTSEAIELLERAYATRHRIGAAPDDLGEAAFALARALRQAGREPARVEALVSETRALCQRSEVGCPSFEAGLAAWPRTP